MKTLLIGGSEYKIKFGFNCFCDTDLLDRVNDMGKLFVEADVNSTEEVSGIGKFKELFSLVRELLYVGFEKYNPVSDIKAVGDLLDTYKEEESDGESRGMFELFLMLSDELLEQGFLADLMKKSESQAEIEKVTKLPTKKKN